MVNANEEYIPDRSSTPEAVAEWLHGVLRRRVGVMRPALPLMLPRVAAWDAIPPEERARRVSDCAHAMAAYCNPKLAARNCDLCGQPYRGPAIYCSLVCAVRDA